MGKKGGIASIFSKSKLAADSPSPPWPWPSCAINPQTASFRQQQEEDQPCTTAGSSSAVNGRLPRKAAGDMYKTVNSVYFDSADSYFEDDDGEADDHVLDDGSFSTTTVSEEWSEAVIRSLGRTSTDRFFFDPGPPPASNSILAASASPSPSRGRTWTQPSPQAPKAPAAALPMSDDNEAEENEPSSTSLVEESVAVALDSEDPYRDFRASMQEMVAAHGLRDWAALREMLLWYLRINGKHNHALIVGAFVDLLVGLATNTTTATAAATTTTTTTTATMTTTTAARSSSSSSSSTSSSGGDVTTCSASVTPANLEEQCGGGTDASCSSASSDQEEDDPVVEELKASEGHCTNSALDSFCS